MRVRSAFLGAVLVAGCSYGPMPPRAPALPAGQGHDPVARALAFLEATQEPALGPLAAPDAWDWPQWVEGWRRNPLPVTVREVSPFAAAVVHLSLARLAPGRPEARALGEAEIERARRLRRRAAPFLERFEVHDPRVPAGCHGFWPPAQQRRGAWEALLEPLAPWILGGPRPGGPLESPFGPPRPPSLGLWPDLDTTALVELARWHAAREAGAAGAFAPRDEPYLAARDLDPREAIARRDGPGASGAFTVWLAPPGAPQPDGLDAVVGAHALLALAATGRADLPGFAATAAWIDRLVRRGGHRPTARATDYYPDGFAVHVEVVRAHVDGPVPALAAAAERLLDDLEASARIDAEGRASWPGADPALRAAEAVLALLLAGRRGPLTEAGLRGLVAAQDPATGGWPPATVYRARTTSGWLLTWRSAAVPTALALEALVVDRALGGGSGGA